MEKIQTETYSSEENQPNVTLNTANTHANHPQDESLTNTHPETINQLEASLNHQSEKPETKQVKKEDNRKNTETNTEQKGEKTEETEEKGKKEEKIEAKGEHNSSDKIQEAEPSGQINLDQGEPAGDNQAEENAQDNWTDATESVANDEQMEVLYMDDDLVNAMDMDSDEEEDIEEENDDDQDDDDEEDQEGQGEDEEGAEKKEKKAKKEKKPKMKEEIDFKELEEQFVVGGQSDEDWKVGKHDKFCTSVAVTPDRQTILTGGGDDRLLIFREKEGKWQQCLRVQHTETVSRIELSHDSRYAVSLTDNEIMVTDLEKMETAKLEVNEPTDVVCHRQGGVLAAAHEYSVSIYNLKGLELYSSYVLDLPPSLLAFSDSGKQLIAACDNKLRLLSPKSGDIIKVSGSEFHREEISSLATVGQLAVTGCIEGLVFVASLVKGNILGRIDPFPSTINVLFCADNHTLIGPQGDGLHWTDLGKFKRIFHSAQGISVSAVVRVHSPHHYAIGDLEGNIRLLDYRAPLQTVATLRAGNSIHGLQARGSHVFAACEDGHVRVFDLAKCF